MVPLAPAILVYWEYPRDPSHHGSANSRDQPEIGPTVAGGLQVAAAQLQLDFNQQLLELTYAISAPRDEQDAGSKAEPRVPLESVT